VLGPAATLCCIILLIILTYYRAGLGDTRLLGLKLWAGDLETDSIRSASSSYTQVLLELLKLVLVSSVFPHGE